MFVGHAALVAHFVNKAVDEPNDSVRNIRALSILKAALCVVAFCHAARNTEQTKNEISGQFLVVFDLILLYLIVFLYSIL